MGPEDGEDVLKGLLGCDAIHKDTIVLGKERLDEQLEDSVLVSLSKAKKLATLYYVLERGLKVDHFSIGEVYQDVVDLPKIFDGSGVKEGCGPSYSCVWVYATIGSGF